MTLLVKFRTPRRLGLLARSRIRLGVVNSLLLLKSIRDKLGEGVNIERVLIWRGSPELVDVDEKYVVHNFSCEDVEQVLRVRPIDEITRLKSVGNFTERLFEGYRKYTVVGFLMELSTRIGGGSFHMRIVVYPTPQIAAIVNRSVYERKKVRPPELEVDVHGIVGGGDMSRKVESFYDLLQLGGDYYDFVKDFMLIYVTEYLRLPIAVATYAGTRTYKLIELVERIDIAKSYETFGNLKLSVSVYRREFARQLFSDVLRTLSETTEDGEWREKLEEVRRAVKRDGFVYAVTDTPYLAEWIANALLRSHEVYYADIKRGRYSSVDRLERRHLRGSLLTLPSFDSSPLISYEKFVKELLDTTSSTIDLISSKGIEMLESIARSLGVAGLTWKMLVRLVGDSIMEVLRRRT